MAVEWTREPTPTDALPFGVERHRIGHTLRPLLAALEAEKMFGPHGTLVEVELWRIDRQKDPDDFTINLQIQFSGNKRNQRCTTVACVLLPKRLHRPKGSPQMRELLRVVRSAFLESARSYQLVNRNPPRATVDVLRITGQLSNDPKSERAGGGNDQP